MTFVKSRPAGRRSQMRRTDQGTSDCMMTVRPVSLNAAHRRLGALHLRSVPTYANAVEQRPTAPPIRRLDLLTAASFAQLVQAQTPAMIEVDPPGAGAPVRLRAWPPDDRGGSLHRPRWRRAPWPARHGHSAQRHLLDEGRSRGSDHTLDRGPNLRRAPSGDANKQQTLV
jgi:hypothetical protein